MRARDQTTSTVVRQPRSRRPSDRRFWREVRVILIMRTNSYRKQAVTRGICNFCCRFVIYAGNYPLPGAAPGVLPGPIERLRPADHAIQAGSRGRAGWYTGVAEKGAAARRNTRIYYSRISEQFPKTHFRPGSGKEVMPSLWQSKRNLTERKICSLTLGR